MPASPSVPARPEEERTKSSPSPRLLTLDDIAPPPSTFTSESFMAQNTLPSESAGLEPLTPQGAHGPSEGGITPAQRDHMESIRGGTHALDSDFSRKPLDTNKARDEQNVMNQWFTWEFWQLMVLCALTILFFSDVVSPLVHWKYEHSLILDSGIFFAQMVSFVVVAAIFSSPRSAGNKTTLTLATIMAALSLLVFLGAGSMHCHHHVTKQMHHVADDLGGIFKPFSHLIVVFLVMQGVLEESASDWANLVMIGSAIALGIAFAMSGTVKDIVCYIFIRLDDYFAEDEFIYFQGELYLVKHIYWRYTEAYRMATRSLTFIPNSEIACNAVNNQSRDDARFIQTELPLPSAIAAAALEAIVKSTWTLLKSVEETGFTATNCEQYECQFDVSKSSVWIDNVKPSPGAQDFACWNLQLKLFGKYYFSKPPKWNKEGPEPAMEARQLEWMPLWNYQVEWFMLEVKKIIESNSKA